MSDQRNRQVWLTRRPTGLPVAGDYAVREGSIPTPGDGEILVRTIYTSIDPAQRGWVLEAKNYVPAVPVGAVMRAFGVGEIVESRSPDYHAGQLVSGLTGWQEYGVMPVSEVQRVVDPDEAPVSTALGVLGLTGLTAYVGIMDICRPTPGSTVVVSTAAGSVGSAAGQIAKVHGARTVGITGSDEKVRMCLEEFGYDAAINYKTTPDLRGELRRACPDGIDGYFDSVGGDMLDAVLDHLNINGRVAICGTISQGGNERPTGPRVERRLLVQRGLMQGFLASDHWPRSAEVAATMAGWMREGRLAYREEVLKGLDEAPAALERVLAGDNLGRIVIEVGSL